MTKKLYVLFVFLILLLATALRFYKLAQVPHGMTWDEAAIGYNGYAIFSTRRDEWLQRLPVSFKSFGDFKAPLAIYLNGIFTWLFGMNLWAVRLPFTLASILAILGVIFLTQILLKTQTQLAIPQIRLYSLISGMIMTFSPWHFHYSRAGFESGLSLMLLIWGIYWLIAFLHSPKIQTWKSRAKMFLSILLLVASLYAYHSAKITTPLLVISVLFLYWKKTKGHVLGILGGGILAALFLKPMIVDSFMGQGLTRSGTLIFSRSLSFGETLQIFLNQLLAHFSPSFLFLGKTTTLRHGDGVWGVLNPVVFGGVVLGLLKKYRGSLFSNRYRFLAFVWVVLGLTPAALGSEVPHSNRALLALPGFLLLAVAGIHQLTIISAKRLFQKTLWGMIGLVYILTTVSYLNHYFTEFSAKSAESFNDGYLEAFSYVVPYEKGQEGYHEVNKVIFTSEYGQPYIYALFVRQTNPIWYQGGSLVKYEFTDQIDVGDLQRDNTIVVAGASSALPIDQADHLVFGSDGQVRFKIYKTFDE